MQSKTTKRYYSPQFSAHSTISVRRLAWALGIPMTKAVDHIVKLLPSVFDPSKVCLSCKDITKCKECAFCCSGLPQDFSAPSAL
jgi:recombinational DNA repair protein RecR